MKEPAWFVAASTIVNMEYGVEVRVVGAAPESDLVLSAARKAARDVLRAVCEHRVKSDPALEERVEKERQLYREAFAESGFRPIYMEQIPNEYMGNDPDGLRSPWYLVTTDLGTFKVGWRKRVMVLDWSRTVMFMRMQNRSAGEHRGDILALFVGEDVTKDESYIHAWGREDLVKYLKVIRGAFPEHGTIS